MEWEQKSIRAKASVTDAYLREQLFLSQETLVLILFPFTQVTLSKLLNPSGLFSFKGFVDHP